MLNCCMRGCSKAVGLSVLSFALGVIAGAFLPIAIIAVIEMIFLLIFGYLCLFKWQKGVFVMKIVVLKVPKCLRGIVKTMFKMQVHKLRIKNGAAPFQRRPTHGIKPYVYKQNTPLGVQKYAVGCVLSVLHLKSSSPYALFCIIQNQSA